MGTTLHLPPKFKRRVLGKALSDPIDQLNATRTKDSLIFIERDDEAAAKTRAAAVMYIGRNGYDLHTSVRENEIWVMKNKDELGHHFEVDLR